MTCAQYLTTYLTERGLLLREVHAVMALVIWRSPTMATRWHDEITDYPPTLAEVLVLTARQCAVEWMEANKPGHGARALFAE